VAVRPERDGRPGRIGVVSRLTTESPLEGGTQAGALSGTGVTCRIPGAHTGAMSAISAS